MRDRFPQGSRWQESSEVCYRCGALTITCRCGDNSVSYTPPLDHATLLADLRKIADGTYLPPTERAPDRPSIPLGPTSPSGAPRPDEEATGRRRAAHPWLR